MKLKRLFVISLIMITLVSCSKENISITPQSGVSIYYINNSYTSLVTEYATNVREDNLDDYLSALSSAPVGEGYVSPLENVRVLDAKIEEEKLTIDFGREYQILSGTKEILVRAAIVRTLTQLPSVKQVEFLVAGDPLTTSSGALVGPMDRNKFVDYFGKEQEEVISENFTVYYANSDATGLVKETHRVYFDNTLSLEQAVIRAMNDEPDTDGAKPAIAQNINVINMTTTDGTCYLDMDMSFYDSNSDVTQSMALFAIVNSLCELKNIRQVQVNIILPEGESGQDALLESLNGTYEKNTEIIIE